MRTRAESSMANDSDNQNDQDGGVALDESREQALRHLDDLRDDDFMDEDIPPTANEYDIDFDVEMSQQLTVMEVHPCHQWKMKAVMI
ncbi:hypothetical protein R1flu_017647 [Riccia fluitans]|uniref:Uncharacterized protein n=1 Tax=Riccia fluitans TaxID=41844 RepID=A0ABD1ZHK2_9MARC